MISVVIRILNEAKHLDSLLSSVKSQDTKGVPVETVIVDSGSTDGSLEIAKRHECNIHHIRKEEFSFGRSLNIGCEAAKGDALVFVSGHCVPYDEHWLRHLTEPLQQGKASYSYGRQIGNDLNKFSELQIFAKYFPEDRVYAQKGFFCNNANAALLKSAWRDHKFDEVLTGLEDMELAKRLFTKGHEIQYVPESVVYHIHEETWAQVRRRYEREAIALQHIMPEVHVHFPDFVRYFFSAVAHDLGEARSQGLSASVFRDVLAFRCMQYWGTYRGNRIHRELSREMKERYFFPKATATGETASETTSDGDDKKAKNRGSFAA